ncbi:MAG: substrate-binding domain-containing protein [Actinomycetales bacterium]|nr:substrate-binding domain-containing protein [Actinomycetales bacterium]
MAATLKDIAQKLGVHPATVSRALNPRTAHLVNAATVERVRKAAAAMNYVPNPMASGLRTSRSHTIGVVIPDLTNPLFPGMVRGMQDTLSRAGYTPLLVNTDNDPATEAQMVASLRARRVDGFILATARRDHPLLVELASRFPIVLINRVTESIQLPSVAADDQHGIRLAVDHVYDMGHREIAHLAGPKWSSTGHERAQAFNRVMRELGLSVAKRNVAVTAWNIEEAKETAMGMLARDPRITAIVAANDQLAIGVIEAARERRLRIPRDLSVIGYNDMPFMDLVDPPLTTIRVPQHEIGSEAARLLLSHLAEEGGTPVKQVRLTPELVVRASTGPPHP